MPIFKSKKDILKSLRVHYTLDIDEETQHYKLSEKTNYDSIPDKYKKSKSFIEQAVEICPAFIQFAPESMKNNKELAARLVITDPFSFRHFSKDIKGDKDFVIHLLILTIKYGKSNFFTPAIFSFLPEELKEDKIVRGLGQLYIRFPKNEYKSNIIETFSDLPIELFDNKEENNEILDAFLLRTKGLFAANYNGSKEYVEKTKNQIEEINTIIDAKKQQYIKTEQEQQQIKNDFEKTLENLGKGKGE